MASVELHAGQGGSVNIAVMPVSMQSDRDSSRVADSWHRNRVAYIAHDSPSGRVVGIEVWVVDSLLPLGAVYGPTLSAESMTNCDRQVRTAICGSSP